MDLPTTLGDDLARICLGAAAGQTAIGDSTTVWLYKLMRAAVDHAVRTDPARTEIVIDTDNFPTDRYVAEGIAAERGLTLRWIEVDTSEGVTADQLREAVGERTALVVLNHVAYRSAWLADAPELTRIAHDAGALVLWDLCHSAGAVPVALDEWDVDLAVGCTYKYLNGGPGSPAFGYVNARLQGDLTQPIQGWMGHADPFLMGPGYTPAPGIRRFISGTPPILGMVAMQSMLELVEEAGIEAIRAKSVALTSYAVELADATLPEVTLASPRDPAQRGGHVTLHHDRMREVTARLWERDVIPDYRDPGGLRIGLSPLSTSFDEVERGIAGRRGGPAMSTGTDTASGSGAPSSGPARVRPGRTTLVGQGVRLEPIGPQHVDDLYAATCGEDDDAIWTYLFWDRPRDRDELAAIVEHGKADPGQVMYAIVAVETGRAVGFCSLMRIDPAMGSIEVGGIAFGRQLQRSRAATEAMALLMRHAFDDLGYRRYEWKCDSLNAPSRRAAIRLGFIWEGRFRNALVYKGRNRDTDWFSITDLEWPRVSKALDAWLDDSNFDDRGRQRVRLAARPPEPDAPEQGAVRWTSASASSPSS